MTVYQSCLQGGLDSDIYFRKWKFGYVRVVQMRDIALVVYVQ